jgi:adenosylhomocysteine nucleosidase
VSLLVVLPLHAELELLAASLTARSFELEPLQVGRLPAQHCPALGLLLAHGGHGKAQFAAQTQHLLDTLSSVEATLCCGVAGALADDLDVGDILLAAATVEHDYTERFTPRPPPRFPGDATLLESLDGPWLQQLPFRVRAGVVASGDEDVVDRERGLALRAATGADAVAWEGAGGARAAAFSGVPYLELRAISDSANHQAANDFRANLARAMENLAALLALWRS